MSDYHTIEIESSGTEYLVSNSPSEFDLSRETLSILLQCIGQDKFLQARPEVKISFTLNLETVDNKAPLDANWKSLIFCTYCSKSKVITNILSCNHYFCDDCTKILAWMKIQNNRILNHYQYYEEIKHSVCPICKKKLTKEDIKQLFDVINNTSYLIVKEKSRKCKIDNQIEISNSFKCFTCKKIRGRNMLNQDSCYHMCKICISRVYWEHKKIKCLHCNYKNNVTSISKEKYDCSACQSNYFLTGDTMIETCPNHLYCINCLSKFIIDHECFICQQKLKKSEKIEILEYIMSKCAICNTELYRCNLLKNFCCKTQICYQCQADSNVCKNCDKQLSEKTIQNIRKARLQINSLD